MADGRWQVDLKHKPFNKTDGSDDFPEKSYTEIFDTFDDAADGMYQIAGKYHHLDLHETRVTQSLNIIKFKQLEKRIAKLEENANKVRVADTIQETYEKAAFGEAGRRAIEND